MRRIGNYCRDGDLIQVFAEQTLIDVVVCKLRFQVDSSMKNYCTRQLSTDSFCAMIRSQSSAKSFLQDMLHLQCYESMSS